MKNLISTLCIMIFSAIFAACSNGYNSPEGVVEKYISYAKSEQYEKIVDITHFKKELTKGQKDETVQLLKDKGAKNLKKKGGLKSIEITGTNVSEDGMTARVHTIAHYGDGSEKKDDIKTIQVDGTWMLDSGK